MILLIIIIIACLIFAMVYLKVVYTGNNEVPEKSDVILILGCQIRGDVPSLSLKYRLDKALQLYDEGYGKYIVVSGGRGADEIMPEAELMKNYLIDAGVDESIIYTEDKSLNTWENINLSKPIIDDLGDSVLIVTSDFHIFRCIKTAEGLELKTSGGAAMTYMPNRNIYRFRETLAVIVYWFMGRY